MSDQNDNTLNELRSYKMSDALLKDLIGTAWEIVLESDVLAELESELIIFNSDQASKNIKDSNYATTNCIAVPTEKLIIIDESFLIEVEAAVRAFEISKPIEGCPYLRSDEDLFRLIDRISTNPYTAVSRMRRLTFNDKEKETTVRSTIMLTYLFFIGHELGHLLNGNEARHFTSFIDADSPLEYRIANAVEKLYRHAEEFKAYGFDLPGFEATLTEGSEIEQSSRALLNTINRLRINHTHYFKEEVDADLIGTKILLEHISKRIDAKTANTRMYHIVRGVFAVALYFWYRDLRIFCRKINIRSLSNTRNLTLVMMRNRESYIHAASLFGEVHRFTLLRAERLLEAVINKRSNVFIQPHEEAKLFGSNDPIILREVVARYTLLSIMMDTAVKIAYIGASTPGFMDIDQKRGTPQLFSINFEPIDVSMKRLADIIG